MRPEIENFIIFSIRYQLVLARKVAELCNTRVYVFDSNGFFNFPNDTTKIEVIGEVKTVVKDGKRAILSVAVKESFGTNEELFLNFVDNNVLKKDDIGLYITALNVGEDVEEQHESLKEVGEDVEEQHESLKEVGEDVEEQHESFDLNDISNAITKIDTIL